MESNVRDSMATTAIRVVKDTARLTSKRATLKTLQLTSLVSADLATGKKAYPMSLGRESFPELFKRVEDLDREIERLKTGQPAITNETFSDRARQLFWKGKKWLDTQRLLRNRKKLMCQIGRAIRESNLATDSSISDELTNARTVASKVASLQQEIEDVAARQPKWMRSRTTLLSLVLGALFMFLIFNSTPAPRSSTTNPTVGAPEAAVEESRIPWLFINSIYSLNSRSTDLQKEEAWNLFKGKTVRWSGSVSDISDGLPGLTLQVKMNEDTLTSDLLIYLNRSERSKALHLRSGDRISFTGKLDDWGTLLPITLTDGHIVE